MDEDESMNSSEEPADTEDTSEEETGSADFSADFSESVEAFRASSITPAYKGKKKPAVDMMSVIRLTALALCAGLFAYCAFAIANRVADDIDNRNLIDDLASYTSAKSVLTRIAPTTVSRTSPTLYDAFGVSQYEGQWEEIDYTGKYDSIRYALDDLSKVNGDIYGWIRCVGGMTDISYPIVKALDNSYYLTRNLYLEKTASGSIFADYRNSFTHSSNYNAIFYGHCMTSGTMFRAVKDWYESPTRNTTANQITIEIITPEAVYIYEIFAAYRSGGNDFVRVSFPDNKAYVNFLESLAEKSTLNKTCEFDASSRIITLSTCTNSVSRPDERYVVHGILKKIVKYS